MNLICKLEAADKKIEIFRTSYVQLDDGELVMLLKNGEQFLAVGGAVELRNCFEGVDYGEYCICHANHENRLRLNELLPWTLPVAFGKEGASFGFGDRLGFANSAQLRAVSKTTVRPVLAQQSLRELQLTGRTLVEVIDNAAWAVFREGYTRGYACDGDHLKTLEEVRAAIAQGCSMITLDCSLVLRSAEGNDTVWQRKFNEQSPGQKRHDREAYIENKHAAELGLHFTEAGLAQMHEIYDAAIELGKRVYYDAIASTGRPIDLEISLDETDETTTPEAHFFVAAELDFAGVYVTSIAPKFVGEFQKAIEYIGDVAELESTMAVHTKIAKLFGYKLSLHSASEKFLVLPIIARLTDGKYHIKTSGTSWLEAVETISKHAPALYRRMHTAALNGVEEAKKHYVVHCDLNNVPALASVSDEKLPTYLEQNDSRQLMHITYGHILDVAELKQEILDFLKENRELYEAEAEELYDRHFAALHI